MEQNAPHSADSSPARLRRELGVAGATMLGLGAILGSGVFVSIGICAGITGPSIVLAIVVAGFVAVCNGLNSAQLAASHPVSGGTYEYGYRYLGPRFGFTAGWMFLLAKSASAATASLGFANYLLNLSGVSDQFTGVAVAVGLVVVMTVLVITGLRRTNVVNTLLVLTTLVTLSYFVVSGLPVASQQGELHWQPFFFSSETMPPQILQACALMFVAYTGYGRVATLGEEIHDPRRNIPIAVITTLSVSMLVYLAVAAVAVGAVGAAELGDASQAAGAPLESAAREFSLPQTRLIIAVGAVVAMAGVLLNLLLGLSRVVLAMGRRGDFPRLFAQLDKSQTRPTAAIIFVGFVIAGIALVGDLKTTWSFSAFTVLIYYALTNLAALKLPDSERLYPRWIAFVGLAACLFLAFSVEARYWVIGGGLIGVGLIWHQIAQRRQQA